MSQTENVETVLRFADAIERGDLGAAEAELAPTVEIDDRDIPDADGHDSFRAWMGRWNDSWETWHIQNREVLAIGDDVVLGLFTMIATGKGSGIELSRDDAMLVELDNGKIGRIGYYNDQAEARAAAGLDAE